nr:carboxypeptidase-like regulatory domain-containing protein [uncultured Carboxylicivirga sp.]
MRAFILTLLFLFKTSFLFAQIINGKIVDSASLIGVEYATIVLPQTQKGVVSNQKGYFSLNVSNCNNPIYLKVSALGYSPDSVLLDNILDSDTLQIKLSRKVFNLEEVVVKPTYTKMVQLGVSKEPKRIMWNYGLPGLQRAIFIDNTKNASNLYISSIGVYIDTIGFSDAPLRIRVLAKAANGMPGKDLLESNVILRNANAGEYNQIDIRENQIAFPKSGVFVSIEWLRDGDEYYYTKKIRNGNNPPFLLKGYGPTVGIISTNDQSQYWKKLVGEQWVNNSTKSKRIHPMIFISVFEE